MSMRYREYRVHHATPDGIVVQLPGNSGFGKLTVETLGNDALAERLLTRLASREQIRAVARRTRDAEQYRQLSIELRELWSGVATYPPPVATLLPQLFRKHVLAGLGTTTIASVVKSNEKGAVLAVPGGLTAVAALERIDGREGPVEVRVLNYDVAAGVANVTAHNDVVERTPGDVEILCGMLRSVRPGDRVTGTVLLSATDDHCAVAEIPFEEDGCSVLGYCIHNWPMTGAAAAATTAASKFIIGSRVEFTVEFVPDTTMLQEAMPFLVLSNRKSFGRMPALRAATPSCAGLVGLLPWRDKKRQREKHAESESDKSDVDAVSGSGRNDLKMRRRKLEESVDAYERGMADAIPSSPEEFQRLLLASPNNSYLWTQYMAHHVSLQQHEEARLVAEKALSTIGVREAQERLNVWVAYMNLENLYGTAESLASVFKRALQRSLDQLTVYERLADIFAASRKHAQLLSLCRTMTSMFRDKRRTWERLGTVLVDQEKRDQLKRLLKEMSEALRRDEYCMTVVHIAIHEYKSGSVENGRALFEGLVMKMPKKSDVWSTYLDQEMALLARRAPEAATALVRNLFERTVATSFSANVMQQFLTRFMAFEKAHGTAADVERVKVRAREYVEAKIHSTMHSGATAAEARAEDRKHGKEHGTEGLSK